jgi:pimeloyl-ACP methyl ester carboxylesterase
MTLHEPPGFRTVDHTFAVPLDHDRPDGELIEVYAREVTPRSPAARTRPWLLYLQGGPGCRSPRPMSADTDSWLGAAARHYRVLLLDQRGTGRSTPADRHTLPQRGGPREQAAYLTHFRADAIVRDAEHIRVRLTGGDPWSVLGQSFGGFCALTYLSLAPQGLREVFVTGGLPGLDADADTVYRAAYPRMERATAAHYARYPDDLPVARRVGAFLRAHETVLPGGIVLTAEAFQSLGTVLGTTDGSDRLHYLLEDAFAGDPQGRRLSETFQEQAQAILSHAGRPLYALLHEAAYAQDARPTAWASERVRAAFPQFDPDETLDTPDAPWLFTGATVHPWHLRTDPALRSLRETAHRLAEHTGWTPLYAPAVLAANTVPVRATVYRDDLYVDSGHVLNTAAKVGSLQARVCGDHAHDGLSASGTAVLDDLLARAGLVPA